MLALYLLVLCSIENFVHRMYYRKILDSSQIYTYYILHKCIYAVRGISLKEVRVDRILAGAVGVQEYKNSVKPASHKQSGGLSLVNTRTLVLNVRSRTVRTFDVCGTAAPRTFSAL